MNEEEEKWEIIVNIIGDSRQTAKRFTAEKSNVTFLETIGSSR